LLVKVPGQRSDTATRTVSRTPFPLASTAPVVSAKCRRLNVPLLTMLLLLPTSCTKPVMVPLLMMLVLLLVGKGEGLAGVAKKEGSGLATARSDKAPMLPLLIRVAVPADEPRITPAADRPEVTPTLVTSGCQPPLINPPDGMLTVTPPLPPVALIAVPNCPG